MPRRQYDKHSVRYLPGRPVYYSREVHPGAEHGYALPDRDIHDKRAANRDWELIFAMFRRQLSA